MTTNTTLLHGIQSEVSNHHANTTVDTEDIVNNINIVFLIIIIFLGTTGNSLVIWVAGFLMKPSVTNIWLINLAVADLIFCLTRVTSLIRDFFYDHWHFGVFLCKFTGFFKYANMFCSVFLLAVISVDRVLCIWRPVLTRERRTLCAARVVSVGVWIVAVIFSSPYFVFREVFPGKNNLSHCSVKDKGAEAGGNSAKYVYYFIRFICGFLLPFLVILICYILAAVGIRRTRLSGKSRPLRILAVLVCAFFLCWAPYHFLLCAARVVSVGVWIVAVIFSSPYFVFREVFPGKNNLSHCSVKDKGAEAGGNSAKYVYYCIRFICGFLLPFLVILICYILAAVGIRRTRLSGKSRPLRILAVLVCAFFLCWAPYHFLWLVKLVKKNNETIKVALIMASKLAYFNSCINPVLYFCMGLDVSQHCNQSLSGIFRRAFMEEGQSLSQEGYGEKSSIPKTADTDCVTVV
uniref:G-protein coupled receptors family 1 profile domain-containing protein n=1 Tax=Cyprinus carpio TaxID=7962 RepID=A0A8C1S4N2_CYPCA